jgi:hypothetical protein
MNRMRSILMVCMFLMSAPIVLSDDDKILFGQVIISRGRSFIEYPSSVENREYFLFRTRDKHNVIKIVHRYYGRSTLEYYLFAKLPLMWIQVHRDTGCDETYESFIKGDEDTAFKSDDSDKTNEILGDNVSISDGSMEEPLNYIMPKKEIGISNDYFLKCYVLDQNDYKVQ